LSTEGEHGSALPRDMAADFEYSLTTQLCSMVFVLFGSPTPHPA